VGFTHFEQARRRELEVGNLHATWSFLGETHYPRPTKIAICIVKLIARLELTLASAR
jgi:hypothetical protein